MPYFPKDTELGELREIKVYAYYDCPRLFLCKNADDQNFIGLSVKEKKNRMFWLYVKISEERLERAEAGEFDIREMFLKAEGSIVYFVKTHGKEPDKVFEMPSNLIPEKYLSKEGSKLIPEKKTNGTEG